MGRPACTGPGQPRDTTSYFQSLASLLTSETIRLVDAPAEGRDRRNRSLWQAITMEKVAVPRVQFQVQPRRLHFIPVPVVGRARKDVTQVPGFPS